MAEQPIRVSREISSEWLHLMQLVEKLGFGEVTLQIKNGKPVSIERVSQRINLTEPEDFKKGLETYVL